RTEMSQLHELGSDPKGREHLNRLYDKYSELVRKYELELQNNSSDESDSSEY
ncbi:MAG: hypothetical protein GY769_06180, partial [bacterium]|nr:hypothetical protein [bacterium]